ncbi:unnamed protein product [[Actinomadura] parvosata subsp. kistnae]|uniref:Uncharacterized protein n=1 Tax=[Actinomadura] parvosata subsp. kistnae TaxID=1909395 RepID=A0A1U9ZX17_9ACTN|nr:hypothetical protein BKM31_14320 [Nonomuraea sp. ATCC 55076]SPL88719.1 unnamed protein product [Actinomadura parvosata subsp. kistnae]
MVVLATAAGCVPASPARGGVTGLTVNAEGRLTVVAAWCGLPPDGVIVYRRVNGDLVDQADVRAPKLSGSSASVDLERVTAGWSLASGDLDFQPGQRYMAGAYNRTTHVRMADVGFTHNTKRKITPGRVLVQDHGNEKEPDGVDVLISEAEFAARARREC